jgi:hypothetical protein
LMMCALLGLEYKSIIQSLLSLPKYNRSEDMKECKAEFILSLLKGVIWVRV